MSYIETYAAANNSDFQGRCQVAMWKAAQDIATETPDAPDHAARLDWATRVLQDRTNITPRQLAMQLLRNAVIASDPVGASDGDIQYTLNSYLSDLIAIG